MKKHKPAKNLNKYARSLLWGIQGSSANWRIKIIYSFKNISFFPSY